MSPNFLWGPPGLRKWCYLLILPVSEVLTRGEGIRRENLPGIFFSLDLPNGQAYGMIIWSLLNCVQLESKWLLQLNWSEKNFQNFSNSDRLVQLMHNQRSSDYRNNLSSSIYFLWTKIHYLWKVELSNMYRTMEGTHFKNPELAIEAVLNG